MRAITDWVDYAEAQGFPQRGGASEAEIAQIEDYGRRLPDSSYALTRLLSAMGDEVGSALDTESGAACKLRPDMRIRESDLTQAEAIKAADKLRAMVGRGEVDGEFQFGALNQSKIIHGHILLQQAKADRKDFGPSSPEAIDSVGALCRWLGSEGFWYD